jgi:hypothetical protein
MKSTVKSMLIIFFHDKGIVHKEFILSCITVNFANYCGILWWLRVNVWRLCPELWRKKELDVASWQCTVSHFFFSPWNFLPKTTVVLHPPYFSLFPWLKIKLKGSHFDTTESIEAESQAVLNTLTEHDFQDAFRKWQKRWGWCIHTEGDYFEGDGGQQDQS